MLSATVQEQERRAYLEPGLRQVFLFIGADPNTAGWPAASMSMNEGSWAPANNSAQTST